MGEKKSDDRGRYMKLNKRPVEDHKDYTLRQANFYPRKFSNISHE